MSFASIRSQTLSLENQTVSSLTNYSSYAQNVSSVASPQEIALESEIQQLVLKRENFINKLDIIADEQGSSFSIIKIQQLARHKEVLVDHKRDFNKIKQQINSERNRHNLLSSVRSDIEEHRQRNVSKTKNGKNNGQGQGIGDELDYLNDERNKANQANSVADMLLEQAYRTRDELTSQTSVLSNANKKFMGTVAHMPGINVLIKKIGTRRRRDSIIMASVISFCILVFFFIL